MVVLWIVCAVLCSSITAKRRDPINWMDTLITDMTEDSPYKVMLITNLKQGERIVSQIIEETFKRIMERFSVERLNLGHLSDDKISFVENDINSTNAVDTSTTFFLLVYESQEAFDLPQLKRMIEIARELSTFNFRPKFLLLLVSAENDSLENVLQHAWSKKLLDFTIIEFTETPTTKKLIAVADSAYLPVIHQLNQFKKQYTRINWTFRTEWFPDKVGNMLGHPFSVAVMEQPPFSINHCNHLQELTKTEGPNSDMMDIIARKLNFSLKNTLIFSKNIHKRYGNDPLRFIRYMESKKIEVMAYLAMHQTETIRYNTLRTTHIYTEKVCAVLPVFIQKGKLPFSMGLAVFFLSFGVITIFSAVLRYVLRFESHLWQPFNIIRVILTVPVDRLPSRISERTLFACLLIASVWDNGNIFASFTDSALQSSVEMEVKSHEELDKTGLIPIIGFYFVNQTFAYGDEALLRLKNKILVPDYSMMICPDRAARQKNITCIMTEALARNIVQRFEREGRHEIKIAEPYFWADSTAFLLARGSPYRSHIDDILLHMHSAGLIDKLYYNQTYEAKLELGTSEKEKALSTQLLMIAVVGYTVAFLAFIAEVAVHMISTYIQSN